MTSPAPPTASATAVEAARDPQTATALQSALAAEHAAVWCFTLIAAFLPPDLDRPAAEGAAAHRTRRSGLEELLTTAGAQPVAAQAAYQTPRPVTDRASAIELATVAESDTTAAWRSVLERTPDVPLRRSALTALTEDTIRCARWRQLAGKTPVVPPFPGQP